MEQRLRILFVTAEAAPFARTGGLGDVIGTLPRVLAAAGHDVRVVMPLYQTVRDRDFPLAEAAAEVPVPLPFGARTARVWQGQLPGPGGREAPAVPVYFIERDEFFARPGLYGTEAGDYPDNAFRFTFFCRAALELVRHLEWFPHVFHCHDWHAALVPAYLRFLPGLDQRLAPAASVLTIHNLAYQGVFPAWAFGLTGLPPSLFQSAGVEFFGFMNFMKAGLRFADQLTTVSPSYAEEICTPEFGFGLDGVLRERRTVFTGILNGADYDAWDPTGDPYTAAPYSAADLSGKAACKTALLRAYGLPEADAGETPLIGMVTRLVDQKGIDLLAEALDRIRAFNLRLVILGSGDPRHEQRLTEAAQAYPQQVGVRLGFDDALSHQIQAGSDCLLMPSRYEPCGLTQLYAMRYGTVPVVRAVGGLRDTVAPFDPATGAGTGFTFAESTAAALVEAVRAAAEVFADRTTWRGLMRNTMARDFSWGRSAARYLSLYHQAAPPASAAAVPVPITFGTSGWRALVAEDFTHDRVAVVARAIVDHLAGAQDPTPRLLVAHDTRFLGREFAETAAQASTAAGARVVMATTPLPTPVVAFEILRRRLDGAVNVTASHNPYPWNGVKFSPAWGGPALPETTGDIARRANALLAGERPGRLNADEARGLGLWAEEEVGAAYRHALEQLIDVDRIRRSGARVAVDLLWGTAGGFLDRLLQEWGVLGPVFHQGRDPYFGGGRPEPVPECMPEMIHCLRGGGLTLGVGCDCDADRFGICDADGTYFVPNFILPLLLDYLVRERGLTGKAGRSVATSHLMDAVARDHGLELVETPVGFKYLGELIARDELLLGGEESGGMSIRGHIPEKDGILACLLAVEMVARTGKTLKQLLSELFARVGPLHPLRQDVHLSPAQQERLREVMAAPPADLAGVPVERTAAADGLKLYLNGSGWLLVRASGTEPVARLYAEAGDEETTRALLAAGRRVFFGEQVPSPT